MSSNEKTNLLKEESKEQQKKKRDVDNSIFATQSVEEESHDNSCFCGRSMWQMTLGEMGEMGEIAENESKDKKQDPK